MSVTSEMNTHGSTAGLSSFLALCKPRVTALIVFTAVIGMFLATPSMVPLQTLIAATLGIAMASGAAAAFNHLIEQKI
ncbi:MAG: heme o synthase, partial [Methylophilaceae bacterium]